MSGTFLWYADLLFLFGSGVLCTVGIFSKHFQDNFLQRVALVLLALTSWGRGYYVYRFDYGQEIYIWYHAGIFLFAIGTWWAHFLRIWVTHNGSWWPWHFPYERRAAERRGSGHEAN